MDETTACPFCETEIPSTAKKCRHCGEWISRDCLSCGTPVRREWAARGYCADCENKRATGFSLERLVGETPVPTYPGVRKSRSVSVALSLVLGGVGAHKFYLEKPGMGILYAMFFWTGIPSIVGIFEAVKYIRLDEEEFHRRFLQRLL